MCIARMPSAGQLVRCELIDSEEVSIHDRVDHSVYEVGDVRLPISSPDHRREGPRPHAHREVIDSGKASV
jgi:hypothetical protein